MKAGLTIAGIAFESVGLVLAFVGFNMTLRRTSPGQSLVPLVMQHSDTFVRERSAALWRWVTRKPKPSTHLAGTAVVTSWAVASAGGYAPLTSVKVDPQAFMEELEAKLRLLYSDAATVSSEVRLLDQRTADRADRIEADVEARFTRLVEEEQRETERDLVVQFWGWSMVVVGLVLGGVSSVI